MKSKELGKELKELMLGFCGGVTLAMAIVLIAYCSVGKANASMSAPDDPYAIQCMGDKCYYITGKEVPVAVLKKLEQEAIVDMANNQGDDSEHE